MFGGSCSGVLNEECSWLFFLSVFSVRQTFGCLPNTKHDAEQNLTTNRLQVAVKTFSHNFSRARQRFTLSVSCLSLFHLILWWARIISSLSLCTEHLDLIKFERFAGPVIFSKYCYTCMSKGNIMIDKEILEM